MRNSHFFIRLTLFALPLLLVHCASFERRHVATAFPLGVSTAQANDAPESAPQRTGIEGLLDKQVDMTFQDTHLQDILDFISENYEINIIFDNRVVRPKEPNRVDPDAKYETDGMIDYVTLKNIPLREALKYILRPLGLSYSVQQSVVWISTPDSIT
ncbi:MAG: hypothetical protein QGD90_05045 [Candidatus Hydrogenedentes bacterium]|nr:hypothetical protein [Candidatus Hydrogenedentota bacterium]